MICGSFYKTVFPAAVSSMQNLVYIFERGGLCLGACGGLCYGTERGVTRGFRAGSISV
jgi:hypothetical protein